MLRKDKIMTKSSAFTNRLSVEMAALIIDYLFSSKMCVNMSVSQPYHDISSSAGHHY